MVTKLIKTKISEILEERYNLDELKLKIDELCTDLGLEDKKPLFKHIYHDEVFGSYVFKTKTRKHDDLYEDVYGLDLEKRHRQFQKLSAIVSPEQRTPAWYDLRRGKITASDGGTIVGVNEYEMPFKFILKKVGVSDFTTNEACYWGNKFEEIATKIYELHNNVNVQDFGMIASPEHLIMAASPDGICTNIRRDGTEGSEYVGRMLEIKCPFSRELKKEGNVYGDIVKKYYWVQTQLQMLCCELYETDFWQVKLEEYESYEDYCDDCGSEDYISEKTGMERGMLIEVIPRRFMSELSGYHGKKLLWSYAKWLYPPRIDMSNEELNSWVLNTIHNLDERTQELNTGEEYVLHKVIYWRVFDSHCQLVRRDNKWISKHMPEYERMWERVIYFREHPEEYKLFVKYLGKDKESRSKKVNSRVMEVVDRIVMGDEHIITEMMRVVDERERDRETRVESVSYGYDTDDD